MYCRRVNNPRSQKSNEYAILRSGTVSPVKTLVDGIILKKCYRFNNLLLSSISDS
jgi:hypothetical protein